MAQKSHAVYVPSTCRTFAGTCISVMPLSNLVTLLLQLYFVRSARATSEITSLSHLSSHPAFLTMICLEQFDSISHAHFCALNWPRHWHMTVSRPHLAIQRPIGSFAIDGYSWISNENSTQWPFAHFGSASGPSTVQLIFIFSWYASVAPYLDVYSRALILRNL